MITDAIAGFVLGLAEAIFDLLPDAGTLDLDGIGTAVGAFKALDAGLPVTETLAMAAMCLAVIGGIFVTRLLITLWHLVPFKFS